MNKQVWAGRIVTALAVLFLIFDGAIKFTQIAPVVDSFNELGYPIRFAVVIGALELLCLMLYVTPRTSILGAVLLTAFLGGAVATHLRIDDPMLTHTLFPVYVGVMVWGGLFLRDARLRVLMTLRSL